MTNLNEREPAALEQENPDESGNDYKLINGHKSCWISMGAFSVYAKLTDEGIVVDIYPYKAELEALASTYAFNSDAEAAYCESEGIDFDEAQAWAIEQGAGDLDKQEPVARMEWLRRFAARAVGTAS